MAKSLKIQIEMAGAEEIKRQLEGVGQAGEDAFKKIIDSASKVGGFKNLEPGDVTQAFEQFGVKGEAAINKVTAAVRSAGRMETLINALTGVENGLAKVQSAASAVDNVLGKALLSSVTRIARFLPAAFAAATIGAIANTTKELLALDAAAIKSGVSIETVSKLTGIFKAIGASAGEASKGVAAFFDSIEKAKMDEITQAVADIKKELATGWFGWEGFKTLERLAQGTGKAAEFARDKLRELGREVPFDPLLKSIRDIQTSTADAEVKFNQLMAIFFQMGNTAQRNAAILNTFGDAMGTTIIQAINAGLTLQQLNTLLGKVPAQSQAATDAAVRLSLAWQQFKNLLASGFSVSVEGLNDLVTILGFVNTALQAVGTAVTFVNEQLRAIGMGNMFQSTIAEINQVINLLGQIGQIGFAAMKYIEAGAIEVWNTIIGWINKAIDAVRQFFSAGGGQAQGAGAGAMARGGIMGGRGTGTSDSNLAWLSRGEHVMPARAVAAPGVLAFLEALRRSGGNLRSVLDRMGHFALGGMVSAPAFARGGAVGGMSNVTIQFPGVQPITGLRASSAVVDELRRSAALAQVRSGGRKPSRYT